MSPAWSRVERNFHEALECSAAERDSVVTRLAAGDADVAREVRALLAGHTDAETDGWLEPTEPSDLVGRSIGEFELVRVLGSGGMGVVYEARQTRPERSVALKVVRALPGVERDVKRFEFESQAMSRLQHPAVAQVYAAGTEEDPGGTLVWFALELIDEARDLCTYAQGEALDRDARLDLFDVVLEAVQHGHARGVLHRDLKPQNVLVDGRGHPKVIDFGVAQLIGTGSTDTMRIEAGTGLAGTLAYMAPELLSGESGARGGPGPFDPRVDVYALGVMLYELLADERPWDLAGLDVTAAISALRERHPAPLGARVRGLSRDFVTVVHTALARDPRVRYESVSALREDLRAARVHRPIEARRPSPSHRARLFVRRHWLGVVATTIVAASLIAVAVTATRAAARGRRLAADEHRARVHSNHVAEFLTSLFSSVRPQVAMGRDVTVREMLDDATFRARRDLAAEPAARGEVLATIGTSYALLGEFSPARAELEFAQSSFEEAGDMDARARVRSELGFVAICEGRIDDAVAILDEARGGLDGASTRSLTARVNTLQRLATARLMQGDPSAARAALLEGQNLVAAHPGIEEMRAQLLTTQGEIALRTREFAAAITAFRAALELFAATLPLLHHSQGVAHNGLANALFQSGDVDGAREHWELALAVFESTLDPGHPDRATVVGNLALAFGRMGERDVAAEFHQRVIALRRAALGDSPRLAYSIDRLGWLLVEGGDLDGARREFADAIEVQGRFLADQGLDPAKSSDLSLLLRSLAIVHLRCDEPEEAQGVLVRVLEIQRAVLSAGHPEISSTLTMWGVALLDQGAGTEAACALAEALEIRGGRPPKDWLAANTAGALGAALGLTGQYAAGEELLLEAVPVMQAAVGERDFRTLDTIRRLVHLYESWDRPDTAATWRARLDG